MYLMGIDIGTTATKIIIINLYGHIIALVEKEDTLISLKGSWAEEDANQWWENICNGIPDCIEKAGIKAEQVGAVGISGMVPTVILLDKDDKVLRNSIQQNDARAVEEIKYLRSKTKAADILKKTGSAITQQTVGPKILWLRNNEPAVLERTDKIMGSYDYIIYCLTGIFSAERNWALESGYFDLYKEDWDDELLQLTSINRRFMGTVRWSSEITGHVTEKAANLTGLKPGTPVAAGNADHIASAFSAGLKKPNDLLIKLGGAGDILLVLNDIIVDERLFLDYSAIPGQYIASGCMASSGSLIKWFRNHFSPNLSYEDLDRSAESISAGSEGLIILPYFIGEKTPIQDPEARGTIVGLSLNHTPAHIYRAILEGISYGFYHHLKVFEEYKIKPTVARCSNGGARSKVWKTITSDVLGLRLEQVANHPGSSLGAAFSAGMAICAFESWNEIEKYIKISEVTEPDLKNHAKYKELFSLYREIYESLKDKFPRILKTR